MRHLKRNAKLGRKGEHRNAMLANMACSLIKHKRITTTLAKAKALRPVAEKMVTLGKSGTIHDRRLAAARLRQQAKTLHRRKEDRIQWREKEDVVRILFDEIAPQYKERNGGYTRIIKLADFRRGDAGEKAILEWVEESTAPAKEKKKTKKPAKAKAPKTEEEAPKAEVAEEPVAEEVKAEAATEAPESEEPKGEESSDETKK